MGYRYKTVVGYMVSKSSDLWTDFSPTGSTELSKFDCVYLVYIFSWVLMFLVSYLIFKNYVSPKIIKT